jgi:hypothetical protein
LTFGRAGAGLVLGIALALDGGAVPADGIMLIEAGAFWMGSDSDDPERSAPAQGIRQGLLAGDGREAPGGFTDRVGRGASHGDPPDSLRVTFRRHHGHRGLARGHHFIGFRCATSDDLGGR